MELGARIGAWSGKPLPYLRRVAYLESDGNQYIDTNLGSSDGFDFSIDVQANNASSQHHIFGCEIHERGIYTYQWLRLDGTGKIRFGAIFYCDTSLKDTDRRTIVGSTKLDNTHVIVDGIKYTNGFTKPSIPNLTWGLFAKNYAGNFLNESFIGKIYSFTMSGVAGSLSFVPVLDLSGRPAMYDEVSGQLFYNQGTGEFTWGELET